MMDLGSASPSEQPCSPPRREHFEPQLDQLERSFASAAAAAGAGKARVLPGLSGGQAASLGSPRVTPRQVEHLGDASLNAILSQPATPRLPTHTSGRLTPRGPAAPPPSFAASAFLLPEAQAGGHSDGQGGGLSGQQQAVAPDDDTASSSSRGSVGRSVFPPWMPALSGALPEPPQGWRFWSQSVTGSEAKLPKLLLPLRRPRRFHLPSARSLVLRTIMPADEREKFSRQLDAEGGNIPAFLLDHFVLRNVRGFLRDHGKAIVGVACAGASLSCALFHTTKSLLARLMLRLLPPRCGEAVRYTQNVLLPTAFYGPCIAVYIMLRVALDILVGDEAKGEGKEQRSQPQPDEAEVAAATAAAAAAAPQDAHTLQQWDGKTPRQMQRQRTRRRPPPGIRAAAAGQGARDRLHQVGRGAIRR